MLAKYAYRIKRWIAEEPDLTLLEIQTRLAKLKVKVGGLVGVPISASSRADI